MILFGKHGKFWQIVQWISQQLRIDQPFISYAQRGRLSKEQKHYRKRLEKICWIFLINGKITILYKNLIINDMNLSLQQLTWEFPHLSFRIKKMKIMPVSRENYLSCYQNIPKIHPSWSKLCDEFFYHHRSTGSHTLLKQLEAQGRVFADAKEQMMAEKILWAWRWKCAKMLGSVAFDQEEIGKSAI